jgi:excisionase family DNA binding protein
VNRADAIGALVAGATPDELPVLAGELARALAAVLALVAAPVAPLTAASLPVAVDTLLTVEQAAERLGVAPSWLYRHARQLPFTRKLGHRTLRFDVRALDRWASTRGVTKHDRD